MPKNKFEGVSQEDKEKYLKNQEINSIWDSIINDFSQDSRTVDIATTFKNVGLDLTNQTHLNMLMKMTAENNLIPCGYEAFEKHDRNTALFFINKFALDNAKSKRVYLLSYLSTKAKGVEVIISAGEGKIDLNVLRAEDPLPNEPRRVPKPNFFKMLFHSWFGVFKKEVDRYNQYTELKQDYDAKVNAIMTEKNAIQGAVDANKPALDVLQSELKASLDVAATLRANRTQEEKLEIAAQNEKKKMLSVDVTSGRSREIVGRHPNYVKLSQTELDDHPELPMAGLALLVPNSYKINHELSDASTQLGAHFTPLRPLNEVEQDMLDSIQTSADITNSAAKVMESYYGGGDVSRMGNRADAAIRSRIALNNATREYLNGNKKPLADLMADSLETIYSHCLGAGGICQSAASNAFIEMNDAVKEMFTKDPELKSMVNFPDEKLKIINGAAKLYEIIVSPDAKKLESYRKDAMENGGPGSEIRKEVLDDMIFANVLAARLKINVSVETDYASTKAFTEITNGKYKDFFAAFPKEQLQKVDGLEGAIQSLLTNRYHRVPGMLSTFAGDNFDLDAYKQAILDRVHETPEYNNMLNMDRDELFKMDFEKLGNEFVKEEVAQLQSKLKSDIDVLKQVNKQVDKQVVNQQAMGAH